MKLTTFVEIVYSVILFIVVIIGITRYKKLNAPFKTLTFCAIVTFLTTLISPVLISKIGTNAPLLHIEDLIEFILFACTYYWLFSSKKIKIAIVISIIVITIFAVINAITFQPFLKDFPTNINMSTLAILAVLSLMFFRQMLLSLVKTPLLNQGVFWYNTAILFYSTTLFLAFAVANYFIKLHTHAFSAFLFYLWYSILYIFAILIALALVKTSKENKNHAV